LGVLSQAILTAGARALRTPLEKASVLISSVAASLRPRIELGPDGSITIALGVEAETHGEVSLLTDALDAIDDLASQIEKDVVVILDEIQQIVLEHGETAERQLRATIQRHRHVGYIFAGSATRLLTTITEDARRPFYRLGERMFLREVPKKALEERHLIRQDARHGDVRYGLVDPFLGAWLEEVQKHGP